MKSKSKEQELQELQETLDALSDQIGGQCKTTDPATHALDLTHAALVLVAAIQREHANPGRRIPGMPHLIVAPEAEAMMEAGAVSFKGTTGGGKSGGLVEAIRQEAARKSKMPLCSWVPEADVPREISGGSHAFGDTGVPNLMRCGRCGLESMVRDGKTFYRYNQDPDDYQAAPPRPGDEPPMPRSTVLIMDERARQQIELPYTLHHDDQETAGQLGIAAEAYVSIANMVAGGWKPEDITKHYLEDAIKPFCWPWDDRLAPSATPLRNLTKAGALLVAEAERIQRRLEYVESMMGNYLSEVPAVMPPTESMTPRDTAEWLDGRPKAVMSFDTPVAGLKPADPLGAVRSEFDDTNAS